MRPTGDCFQADRRANSFFQPSFSGVWTLKCLLIFDPLEKGMATHSCILAWRIPWTKEPGGLQSMGSQRIGCDWVANTFTFHFHSTRWLLSYRGTLRVFRRGTQATWRNWRTIKGFQSVAPAEFPAIRQHLSSTRVSHCGYSGQVEPSEDCSPTTWYKLHCWV